MATEIVSELDNLDRRCELAQVASIEVIELLEEVGLHFEQVEGAKQWRHAVVIRALLARASALSSAVNDLMGGDPDMTLAELEKTIGKQSQEVAHG